MTGGQFGISVRDDLIIEIYMLLLKLTHLGIQVEFCWIPSHVGIEGNEAADKLAKRALGNNNEVIEVNIGRTEAKSFIQRSILKTWQEI